jgi:hypothetical protein
VSSGPGTGAQDARGLASWVPAQRRLDEGHSVRVHHFADPQHCPDCGASIDPTMTVCAACRLPLRTADAEALWRSLLAADASLVRLRVERDAVGEVRTTTPVSPYVLPGAPQASPTTAMPAPGAPHRRPVSVPVVLLGLGGLLLVVAAVVFVAVTWGRLSLGVRTTVLLAVTAGIAGAAAMAVRRRLRITAEVLALVTAGFLVVDLVAARVADLLGLGGVTAWVYQAVCGALLALLGATGSRAVQGRLPRLVGAEVVTVGALAFTTLALGQGWSGEEGTFVVLVVLALGLVAVAVHLLGLVVAATGTAVLAVLFWLLLVALTLPETLTFASMRDSWLSADGIGLLAAAGIAGVVARLPWRGRAATVAAPAASAAVVVAGVWLWAPAADELSWLAVLSAAAIMLVAALGTRVAGTPWSAGLRVAAAVAAAGVGVAEFAAVAVAAQTTVDVAASPWSMAAGDVVETRVAGLEGSPWWVPVAAVLLVVAVVAALPPPARLDPRTGAAAAVAAGAVALTAAVVLAEPPLALAVAVVLTVGAAGVLTGLRLGQRSRPGAVLAATGAVLALTAVVLAAGSRPVAAVAWPVAAVLAGVAAVLGRGAVRAVAAGSTVALAGLATAPWSAVLGADVPVRGFVAAAAAGVALVAAQLPRLRRDPLVRTGLEVGAAVTAVRATAYALPSPWWLAATLTVTGAAVVAVALLAGDRRRAGWLGGLLLVAASWVRLADAGVDQVEAYTLPSALALLVVGVVAMRRDPSRASVPSLGPGLALALAPSLVLSLEDPVSVRGLLTGLAGLVLVALGVALRWSALLVAGAVVTAVLAVRHLTPVAAGLPRWIVLGTAGVALVVVGATWEKRRRDVRAAARYVAALR